MRNNKGFTIIEIIICISLLVVVGVGSFISIKVISKKQFKQMIETEGSYGFGIYHKDNMIFHGGTTNVFNAYNCYYLDSGLSIIVLSNTSITQTNTAGIAGKIYKLYENLL